MSNALTFLGRDMLISLGGRLWYLQVMNNTAFTKLAAANQTRSVIVPAVRGQILDDVGNRLVTNKTALVVSVDMGFLSRRLSEGEDVQALNLEGCHSGRVAIVSQVGDIGRS